MNFLYSLFRKQTWNANKKAQRKKEGYNKTAMTMVSSGDGCQSYVIKDPETKLKRLQEYSILLPIVVTTFFDSSRCILFTSLHTHLSREIVCFDSSASRF